MLPMLRNRFVAPTMFEPWGDLRREIDRLFDAAITGLPFGFDGQSRWMPAMDIEETDDRIRLTFEVPGVNEEELHVTIENNVLTVSGEKRFEREEGDEQGGSRTVERRYGRFSRSVMLPSSVESEQVTAHYDNGVLTIELPKSAQSRRRKIEIGRGTEQKQLGAGKAEGGEKSRKTDSRERQVA